MSLLTHLSNPKGDFINLVNWHKCLHIVKQENIVENGRKQGQRAVEHCSRDDALPAAPDTPAHSSFSITLLRLFLCAKLQPSHGLAHWGSPPHHSLQKTHSEWKNALRFDRNVLVKLLSCIQFSRQNKCIHHPETQKTCRVFEHPEYA